MLGGGFPGSFNDDVLNAQPVNDEQRLKLIDEIKSRAKACISSRNYPEAVRLYSRAIELTTDDNVALSVLFANRSMVQLNMSKAADALTDADESVKLDGTYLKGYYRQAMAALSLNDLSLAKRALTTGLALKPDDKDFLTQLAKVDERIQNAAAAPAAPVPAATNRIKVSHGTSTSAVSAPPQPPSSNKTTVASKPPSQPAHTPTATIAQDNDDDEKDLEALNVRGYKKTADGRTTTFFNHELDEETKKLIGSIAPKKLDAQGEVITTGATAGSAWNAAGTYEEKIFTSWANEKLQNDLGSIRMHLTDTSIPLAIKAGLPDLTSLTIEVVSTENVNGHAQVTMNRGKKKHVCDYSATLTWQMILVFSEISTRPVTKVQGAISVVDITADREYEVENAVVSKLGENATQLSGLPSDLQNAFNKAIKSSDGPFQREILSKLNVFWDEFKTK